MSLAALAAEPYGGLKASNVRLRADARAALRAESLRTGRSRQDLIREAVDLAYGLGAHATPDSRSARRAAELAPRGIVVARTPFDELSELIRLPGGLHTMDLLDRADGT